MRTDTTAITTRRSRFLSALALALAATGAARAEPLLDELGGAARACRVGPARATARALVARGDAGTKAASVLPNPELVVEHDRILTSGGGHETTAGVGLPLGVGGRRGLAREAAGVRKVAARAEADATLLERALEFRQRFVEVSVADARVAVVEEQQRALDGLAELIRGLAKGGEVAGFDTLRQESQARAHRRVVTSARARARSTRRLLESWAGAPIRAAQDLDQLGGGAGVQASADAARRGEHPRVRALEATAQAARLEARAERRRAVPDLGVFLGYRTVTASAGGGSATGHGFRAGLVVPLPFFDHGQGSAAQADADALVARSSAAELRRENGAVARARGEHLALLEKSRPDADAAARDAGVVRDKARQLYAAGELSITELLDAFRAAEEARLARVDLAEEIALTRLALMRALGTQLDARLDAACGSQP